jgi:two-component system cell cycle response regulator DivK
VKRVVIVEDNASVAKYFRYVLEHDGFATTITESGDEVVALARQAETVAVIVDVSLRATQYEGRYIDGVELSRILKTDPQTALVPVIIATAHVMAGDRERFLRESHADGFVRKPLVDPNELVSLVSELTAAGRPPSTSSSG